MESKEARIVILIVFSVLCVSIAVSAPGHCPKDNCEDLTCSGAKGRFRDVDDCPYCKCLRNCPPFQCTLNCDKGYLSDENGCQLCSCKKWCPSVSCALICPCGMKRTKDGCPYCSCCNDLPCLKTLSCEEFEVDSSGCATCSCKQSRFSDLII